jgi:hypothetical protein
VLEINKKIQDNLKAIEILYALNEIEAAALLAIEVMKFEAKLQSME